MIAPEDVRKGDLLGIYSPDGSTYRGNVIVREVIESPTGNMISFNGPLPNGTTQGDILCLIRRGDEVRILQSRELAGNDKTPEGKIHNGELYLPSAYINGVRTENIRLNNEIDRLKSAVYSSSIEVERIIQESRRKDEQLRQSGIRLSELQQQLAIATGPDNLTTSQVFNLARRYRIRCCGLDDDQPAICSLCLLYDRIMSQLTGTLTPSPQVSQVKRRIKSSSAK